MLSGFLWAFGTVVVMVLLICIPYGAPARCCGCANAASHCCAVLSCGADHSPHPPPGSAAFAGYAVYDVQGARSGLLPVEFLSDQNYPFSQCIGLFSYYNAAGNTPKVNASLTTLGYSVRAGSSGTALRSGCHARRLLSC